MRCVVLLTLGSMWGCGGCEPDPGMGPCTTRADCEAGSLCIDGRCVPGTTSDAGDASTDGGDMDSGTERCVQDDECGSRGVCLAGECCVDVDYVCGDSCCGVGERCFASACVVPGDPCRSSADCASNEYCEPGLGDDPMDVDAGMGDLPTDGGMPPMLCLELPAGRCVALPPRCGPGVAPPCINECEYRPDRGTLNAILQWRWGSENAIVEPSFVDVWATPAVGRVYDTNCDTHVDELDPPNVVVVSGDARATCCSCGGYTPSTCRTGVLRVIDGASGRELWSLRRAEESSIGFAGLSVALGDIDGDGGLEIAVVTGEYKVAIIDGNGDVLMVSTEVIPHRDDAIFGWGGGLAMADMNGDGAVEVSYGDTVFTTMGGVLRRLFVGGLGVGGRQMGDALSFMADVAGDANLELVAGQTVYDFAGGQVWHRGDLNQGFPAVGNMDDDPEPEVVYVASGSVYVLRGADGTTEYGPFMLRGTGAGGPPTIADFDGDGRPEIGVAQQNFYSMIDLDAGALREAWATPNHDLSSSVTGSTVFDFEGDGIAEVVYNDECFLWVYDGPTGAVRFAAPTTSFTATEASLVADIDGDGHADILMGSNGADPSSAGWGCDVPPWNMPDPMSVRPAWTPPSGAPSYRGLSVFRDRENSWVGTRQMWNQHAYHVTNICDARDTACDPPRPSGAIPARERPNWELDWLNNFRQNVQEEGLFDAPDAVVTLTVRCVPFALVAAVQNLGEAVLPAGVQVGFYRVDGGAETLVGVVATTSAVFAGGAAELVLEMPAGSMPMDTFRARILIDEAARTFRECNEANNTSEDATGLCLL